MATTPDHKPSIAPVVGPDDPRRFTDSGIEIKHEYTADDVAPALEERLGEAGDYPYTRGIHPDMYRGRKWTMRQYAGYATAAETNQRFRYLIEHGSTGLSMAFDLPTQLGRDSDDPLCLGEVGRTGVAIDTIDDMRRVFESIPLGDVSTSMTINAPAAVLLLLYELVGEEQGVPAEALPAPPRTTCSRSTSRAATSSTRPCPAMRLTTDLFAYCHERIPKWNTISISGYHMREKGCSAVQEVGFTLANAIAYVQAALDAGLEVDEFGPRLAFFFNGHNNVFQEVAKFRAARRMWARIMRERFGAKDERSLKMRFHTQTGRRDAGRAAAREQHRARGAAGLRRRLRRHPVAPHERLRRGAGAAERARRADRAAHAADPRPRDRRDRHRRPVRRLLLRGGAHRRDRGGGAGADRQGRRDGRLGAVHPVHPRRGRGVSLGLRGALQAEAGHRRRA